MSTTLQSTCVLGRQPALGLAELESLYDAEHVWAVGAHAAGLDLEIGSIDFKRLGGSTRFAKVLAEIPSDNWKAIEKYLVQNVPKHLQYVPEGKLQLGLSAYGFSPKFVSPARISATGLTLKKVIRSHGRSVRLVPNQTQELSTAQVLHNHLTGKTGWELLLIANGSTTLLAQTIAVQDIDSYTLRDRGRPKRDARVGMLPPKLAQIITNLAAGQTKPSVNVTILDPFCGTGVLLQEALLMGFDVYGTDLEPRMIDYSTQNLAWANETFDSIAKQEFRLEVGDATTHAWSPAPQFVAGETYLGRPFTSMPDRPTLEQNVSDVNLILKKFLQNIHCQLAPGARLCLGVPAWQLKPGQFKHLPLLDSLESLGYNRVELEHVRSDELIYYRDNQIVARQLLILTVK